MTTPRHATARPVLAWRRASRLQRVGLVVGVAFLALWHVAPAVAPAPAMAGAGSGLMYLVLPLCAALAVSVTVLATRLAGRVRPVRHG
jgi:hypothetical protein